MLLFPIIEGKASLDMVSPTGFWGQLALAIVIAEALSLVPLFGKTVGMCVGFFGFEDETPGARICGTVVGATLLFCIIGLAEIAFQTGIGTIEGVPYFARWAKLVTDGWGFVVVAGLLFGPFADAIAGRVLRD